MLQKCTNNTNPINRNKGGLITISLLKKSDGKQLTGICTIWKWLNDMTVIKQMFYVKINQLNKLRFTVTVCQRTDCCSLMQFKAVMLNRKKVHLVNIQTIERNHNLYQSE